MSLRHKNTSRHMRTLVRNRDGQALGEANQIRLTAQARVGEEGDSSEEDDVEMAKKHLSEINEESEQMPTDGVFALKFMQRAHQAQQERAKEEAEMLLESMVGGGKRTSGHGGVLTLPGRTKYGQDLEMGLVDKQPDDELVQNRKATRRAPLFESQLNDQGDGDDVDADDDDDDDDEGQEQGTKGNEQAVSSSSAKEPPLAPLDTGDNPWLVPMSSSTRGSRQNKTTPAIQVDAVLKNLPVSETNEENEELVRRAFADAGVVAEEFEKERAGSDGACISFFSLSFYFVFSTYWSPSTNVSASSLFSKKNRRCGGCDCGIARLGLLGWRWCIQAEKACQTQGCDQNAKAEQRARTQTRYCV